MANYVDVETSVEGLREAEELIEAVEAVVEIAAVSVKNQILHEINSGLEQGQAMLESWFPILIDYQENPSLLWNDLEHLALFLALFLLAFALLAPSWGATRRRGKEGSGGSGSSAANDTFAHRQRRRSFAGEHLRSGSYDSNSNSNNFFGESLYANGGSLGTAAARYLLMEEETDEERFARVYPSLLAESSYANLILPPTCQLLESHKAIELINEKKKQEKEAARRESKQHKRRAKQEKSTLDVMDDPAERLITYFRHLLVLARSLFTYDYAGAAWTITLWMQGILHHRRINSRTNLSMDDDLHHNHCHHEQHDVVDQESESLSTKQPQESHCDCEPKKQQTTVEIASTPFTTPQTASLPTKTAEVNPQTPLVPLLDTGSSSNSNNNNNNNSKVLSPLPEEPKAVPSSPTKNSQNPFENAFGCFLKKKPLPNDEPKNDKQNTTATTKLEESPSATNSSASVHSSAKTVVSANISAKNAVTEDGENDAVPETPRSQLSNESPAKTAQSRLRSASWYFFDSAHSKESLKQMSLDVPVPDKNGYVLGDEYLPDDSCTPLLVFVNSRSGSRQGHFLMTQLRRLLNPIQIWDLAEGGPETALESFCSFSKLRILVCGGDGTVSWIISALDSLKLTRKWPPIAILPLGTGNDLARVHGWGPGYNNESILAILEQVSQSYTSVLDRWELTIEEGNGKKKVKNFLNYFSFGVDAEAALQVHQLRETRPGWFFSRLFNKVWYAAMGAEQHIKGHGVNIRREVALYADGIEIPLPADSQGIIIMNIDSYAGGTPLWSCGVKGKPTKRYPAIRRSQSMGGLCDPTRLQVTRLNSVERTDSNDDFSAIPLTEEELFDKITCCEAPASCQDGYLEIVSVRGVAHLAQCTLGVGNAERVGQCRELKIVLKKKVAVQIDGEPWRQDTCVLRIKRKPGAAFMLHRSEEEGGLETEMSKLLEWAEDRKLIDTRVHSVLMKEFSRRIESKKTERRVRAMDHSVVQHLKRAIGTGGSVPTHMYNMGGQQQQQQQAQDYYDDDGMGRARVTPKLAGLRTAHSSGGIAF